jgi:hypothetical protein
MKVNHELIDTLLNKFRPAVVEPTKLLEVWCISQNKDSFMCRICYEIVHQPTSCLRCENFFCGACIESCLRLDELCPNY